jgi:hypothetical protein
MIATGHVKNTGFEAFDASKDFGGLGKAHFNFGWNSTIVPTGFFISIFF